MQLPKNHQTCTETFGIAAQVLSLALLTFGSLQLSNTTDIKNKKGYDKIYYKNVSFHPKKRSTDGQIKLDST